MNTLLVLLDGAKDHPIPEFGGLEPLEKAEMPFIKSADGTVGETTGRGYTHLFLNEFFTGKPPMLERAVLEALGLGMDMGGGRTAFRLSPAYLDDETVRWAYDTSSFYKELQRTVSDCLHIVEEYDPRIEFFISGRAILTMDCDPVPGLPAPPVDAPRADIPGPLGELVEEVCRRMGGITDYPWGCGRFTEQYTPFPCLDNLTAFSDSPTSLGICASLGYDIRMIRDFDDRFVPAREALEKGNVFLHLDEIDEYSHMRDPEKKVAILERADRLMEKHFSDAERIVYFIDHGTSSVTGEHLPINTPFRATYATGIRRGELVSVGDLLPRLMSP